MKLRGKISLLTGAVFMGALLISCLSIWTMGETSRIRGTIESGSQLISSASRLHGLGRDDEDEEAVMARKNPFKPVAGFFARWEGILSPIFVAVIVFNSVSSPYFLDPANLLDTTFNFVERG